LAEKIETDDMIGAVNAIFASVIRPEVCNIDRHRTWWGDRFREAMLKLGIVVDFGLTAGDHRHVAVEAIVRVFGLWRQSLPDATEWHKYFHTFVGDFNNQYFIGTISRINLAFSAPRALIPMAMTLVKTGHLANKKPDPVINGVEPGRAMLMTKQKTRGDLPFREVNVREIMGHKALVSDTKGDVFYVALRDLKPLAAPKSDVKADVRDVAPPPGPDDWIVYRSLSKCHLAQVKADQKDDQILICSGEVKKDVFCFDWLSDETGLITNARVSPPGKFRKAEWIVESRSILGRWPPSDRVPTEALKMMADFKRDPKKFK
jgi:hypothetical protein